jgi:hypothetical protein
MRELAAHRLPGRRRPGPAAAAIAWLVVFGGLHLAWAAGSRVGLLDAAAADEAFRQPWFRLYNLSVVLGCLALACAVPGLTSHRRRLRLACGRLLGLGGVALVLRGGLGGLQLVSSTLTGDRAQPVATWWPDAFMLLGGLLLLWASRWAGGHRPEGRTGDRRPRAGERQEGRSVPPAPRRSRSLLRARTARGSGHSQGRSGVSGVLPRSRSHPGGRCRAEDGTRTRDLPFTRRLL